MLVHARCRGVEPPCYLPVATLITEPAVGLGAAGGLAFIDTPLGAGRPDIAFIGGSPVWVGLSYSYAQTGVAFDAPAGAPGLPAFSRTSRVGGVGPSVSLDTRDNLFTPLRPALFLGLRGQAAASSEDTPFYLRPFIYQRGVPAMRYRGEEMAQIEVELRWQCWKRLSAVGFGGAGATWTSLERAERQKTVAAGGAGIRYELARRYGIHVGEIVLAPLAVGDYLVEIASRATTAPASALVAFRIVP